MNRYERDKVTGRFVRPVEGVDAESRFGPMGDSIQHVENVSGAPSPNMVERPRHAPYGDTLAGPSYPGPLRPRTAMQLDSQRPYGEVHAPDRSALHAEAMREAAGPRAGDLDPVHYLVGNIDEIRE